MLIVAGTMEVAPERREEFIAGREAGMRRSQAEPGCIEYVFTADPLVPGLVHLFERWESKEHLATHLEGIRSAEQPAGADAVPVLSAEVLQYEISAVGPVGS
jgi:quinol monooxygenase YgiN